MALTKVRPCSHTVWCGCSKVLRWLAAREAMGGGHRGWEVLFHAFIKGPGCSVQCVFKVCLTLFQLMDQFLWQGNGILIDAASLGHAIPGVGKASGECWVDMNNSSSYPNFPPQKTL